MGCSQSSFVEQDAHDKKKSGIKPVETEQQQQPPQNEQAQVKQSETTVVVKQSETTVVERHEEKSHSVPPPHKHVEEEKPQQEQQPQEEQVEENANVAEEHQLPQSSEDSSVVHAHREEKSHASVGRKTKVDYSALTDDEKDNHAATEIQRVWKGRTTRKTNFSRMLICYSCGQKFGPTSLAIHHKDCPTQRTNDMKEIPKAIRPDKPDPPQTPIPAADTEISEEIEAYNEEAYEIYREHMCTCPNAKCGRKFECDRFLVHLKSCKDEEGKTWHEHEAATKIQSAFRGHQGRKMLVCYCCGQEYGTKSLPIHLKDCPTKREVYFRVLPDDLRKPVPNPPNAALPNEKDPFSKFQDYNTEAREIYKQSMAQCTTCSRRFEPDRLLVHMNKCTPKL